MLLPPKVVGPISELSTQITVVGAVNGASVQLLANGAPLAAPALTSGLSVSIPVAGAGLAAGQKITARQSLGAETSSPSPFAETVNAAPPAGVGLPAVVFLSAPHPCSDWVVLGGTVPGATAVVVLGGATIGTAVSQGPAVSVPVTMPAAAAAGQVLDAFQTLTLPSGALAGPKVQSLPLQARPAGEPPPPRVEPPFECDRAVLVSDLIDGTSLVVKHDTLELAGYPYVGTPVWALLADPVRAPQQISARQRTASCGADSPFSTPVGVNPAPKLPTPIIVGAVCPNAPILLVRNLRPGATVTVFVKRTQSSGGSSSNQVGQATAWAPECDLPMPPGWADAPAAPPPPGQLSVEVFQENCDRGSDTASRPVQPLPGAVGQPVVEKPVECGRIVRASGLTPGAFVTVDSDQADWPALTSPLKVLSGAMAIWLNRPLRKQEHVTVVQGGCNAGAASASVEAAPFAGVEPPVIESPVRVPAGQVGIRKLLVGARLHVFVNGAVRVSTDVDASRMVVPLALKVEDIVTARQAMCARMSDESNREPARLGVMKTAHTPSPITRGKAESVTVTASDADDGRAVNGSVRVAGTVVAATGAAFGITFPATGAPAAAVEAPGYTPGAVAWNLVDPPPTPPAMLHLAVTNQASTYFKMTAVQWTVVLQEVSGNTVVATPTGESVTVTPPKNGQYLVRADVSVDDLAAGENVLAEFRGNTTISGQQWLVLVWSGAAQSRTMRLTAETQQIWAGGVPYTVVNPVVVQ